MILSSTTSHASTTLFGDLDRNGNANAIVCAIDMARYGHDSTTTTTNGYDTMTMSSGAGDEQRGDVGNVLRLTNLGSGSGTQQDSSNSQILGLGGGLDSFDHDLNFDGDSLLDDGANQHNGLPSLPFTPSYDLSDAFSTTFEDPFSYPGLTTSFPSDTFTSSSYPHDHHHPNHVNRSSNENENEETSQHDLDNKMLGFGAPVMKAAILDSEGNQSWPTMSAELYGMFFVAEDVFGDQNGAGRPMELTCYRRNLFQISGTVTLSRSISHMLNDQNQRVPLFQLACTLSALESIEGKTTEIISVPWKTSAASGTTTAVEDKSGASPPSWPLDLSMNPELDPASVSIPIAWKRLQFKHATANNGRRKGLQQHYVVQISLVGVLGNGERVTLAEMRSGPIIVRGRSPRNFDSRKDVALSERRVESRPRLGSDSNTTVSTPVAKVDLAPHNAAFKFYALNALQTPLDLPDWTANSTPLPTDPPLTPRKKQQMLPSNSNTNPRPPVPKTKWKAEVDHKPVHKTSPIDLSLTEDSSYSTHGGKGGPGGLGLGAPTSPLMNRKLVSSPVESADLLYEYFPLSLDDWMPPVDAIYRPHVVHHTIVPPDLKASMVKNKTKRYFSAED